MCEINTGLFSMKDLMQTATSLDGSVTYPIIIRLEALTEEGRAEDKSLDAVVIGEQLPVWVQCQTTYARLCKEKDTGAAGWGTAR